MRDTDIDLIGEMMFKYLIPYLMLCSVCSGATFYMDIDASGADNGGSGNDAWQTIASMLAGVDAIGDNGSGDTVLVQTGTYSTFTETGVARTDWLIIKADTAQTVVFNAVQISNGSEVEVWLRFEGITIRIPDTWYTDNEYETEEPDNWPVPPTGGSPRAQNDDLTDHVFVADYAKYIYLYDCVIYGLNHHLTYRGVNLTYCDDFTLDHCEIHTVKRPFTTLMGNNNVIKWNHIHGHGGGSCIGIRPLGDVGDTITGSEVIGNHIHDDVQGTGIGDDPYYPETDFHAGTAIAIRVWNVSIQKNLIYDLEQQGIMFYLSDDPIVYTYSNFLVENNCIYDITSNTSFNNVAGAGIIRNNTFIGHADNDVFTDDPSHWSTPDNGHRRRYQGVACLVGFDDAFDGTDFEYYNNVVVCAWELPEWIEGLDPTFHPNYDEDYNIWWSRYGAKYGTPRLQENSKGANSRMAVWMDGSNNYHGNPEYFEDLVGMALFTPEYDSEEPYVPFFTDAGFYTSTEGGLDADRGGDWDYTLAVGSPGINFGLVAKQSSESLGSLDGNGFLLDNGLARDADHHSIGAYEFGSPAVVITESSGSTDVAEEGTTEDTYTIVLTTLPTNTVTITIDPDVDTEVNGNGAGNTDTFDFTTGNWESAQTVTVKAIDDVDVEGTPHISTINHTASSTDTDYDGISIDSVLVNVTDNDGFGGRVPGCEYKSGGKQTKSGGKQ